MFFIKCYIYFLTHICLYIFSSEQPYQSQSSTTTQCLVVDMQPVVKASDSAVSGYYIRYILYSFKLLNMDSSNISRRINKTTAGLEWPQEIKHSHLFCIVWCFLWHFLIKTVPVLVQCWEKQTECQTSVLWKLRGWWVFRGRHNTPASNHSAQIEFVRMSLISML